MHKLDQSELQLDQSQLSYSEHLSPAPQETAQPNIVKKAHNTLLNYVNTTSIHCCAVA